MRNNSDFIYGSNPPVADFLYKQEVSRLQYVQTGSVECSLWGQGREGDNSPVYWRSWRGGSVPPNSLCLQGVDSEYLIKKIQGADDIANNPTR